MKYFHSAFFAIIFFISCNGQENKETIKTSQDIYSIDKEVKKISDEPIYRLKIESSLSYIIKINGITTAIKNQNAGNTRWFLINNCIPQSGEQDIEITLFPRMNNEGSAYISTIGEADKFFLDLEKTAWKKGSLIEPTVIYSYNLSKGDYVNKATYYHKDIFKAEVPYQLVNWRDGENMSIKDSTKLKEDILRSYEKIKSHFEHQQGEEFVKLIDKGMFNLAQGSYLKPAELEDLKKDKINFINKQKRELEKLENYKLEFSGSGKLISLRRTDGYNTGEGVIRRKYKKNGQETVHIDDLVFYMPKNAEHLEVIVYQNLVKPFYP